MPEALSIYYFAQFCCLSRTTSFWDPGDRLLSNFWSALESFGPLLYVLRESHFHGFEGISF